MRKFSPPPCAKTPEQRQQLGRLLQQLVYAGLEQKGEVETWWARCERDHRNEWSEDSAPGTGLTPVHVPFSQPRVDMLTAQVCTVLAKQEPYMLAESLGSDTDEDTLEKTLHKFWKSAGFEMAIRRASHICVDTNRVWFRVAWEMNQNKPFAGVILDVIHPRNTCIFPATLAGIQAARLVGHRFYRRRKDVMALQESGVYANDEIVNYGDNPTEYDESGEIASSGASPGTTGPDPNDERVELWDVVVRYEDPKDPKSGESWYRATFAFKTAQLLSFEPYPYSRPWYFDASYIVGNEEAYWSAVSVSRHLSGLQDAVDKMTAAVYNGSMMTAFPAVWGPELPQKDARYGYGEYIPTDSPLQNWSPSISFKGDALMQSIQGFDMIGDRTARISANAQGSPQDRGTTATENSIIAAGVAVGVEEYISTFSAPLGDMAQFTCELLSRHFAEWGALYAPVIAVTPQLLSSPTLWEANGKTPGNTPGAKLAAIEKLVGLLQAFGPATGLDPYTLTQIAIANMGFNAPDNLQIDKEQLIANQQAAAAQQLAAQPAPGPGQAPGIPTPHGVPPGPPAGAPAPMPSPGSPG